MSDDAFPLSGDVEFDKSQSDASALAIALVRVLSVAASYQLGTPGSTQAVRALKDVVNRKVDLNVQRVQILGDAVECNGHPLRLVNDEILQAVAWARNLFARLGVVEIAFYSLVGDADLEELIKRLQGAFLGRDPQALFALEGSISVFATLPAGSVSHPRRLMLAEAYAQLTLLLQDVRRLVGQQRGVAMAAVRRAITSLVLASDGQPETLAALTRFCTAADDPAVDGARVTALSLLMGQALGLDRKRLVSLALAAAYHQLAHLVEGASSPGSNGRSLAYLCRFTGSLSGLDRTAVTVEHLQNSDGKVMGLTPSPFARLIAVASAYATLTAPPVPLVGLSSNEAVRALLDGAFDRFDRRAVQLLVSVVGQHAPGSLVQLSSGQRAVVIRAPQNPAEAQRPTVRVIDEHGRPDRLLDLATLSDLWVTEGIDALAAGINVTRVVLAPG